MSMYYNFSEDDDTSYNPRAHMSTSLSDPTALFPSFLSPDSIADDSDSDSASDDDNDEPIIPRHSSTFTQRPPRSRPSVWQLASALSSSPPPVSRKDSIIPPPPSSSSSSSDAAFAIPNLMTRAGDMLGSLRGASLSASPERGGGGGGSQARRSVQGRFADLFPKSASPQGEPCSFYPSSFSAAFPSSSPSPSSSPLPSSTSTSRVAPTQRQSTLQSAAKFINQGLTGLMGASRIPSSPTIPEECDYERQHLEEEAEEGVEFLTPLDIRRALLASTSTASAAALPSRQEYPEKAFADLLANAESLVARMQAAARTSRRERSGSSRESPNIVQPSAASDEELHEAHARASTLRVSRFVGRDSQWSSARRRRPSGASSSSSEVSPCRGGDGARKWSVFSAVETSSAASSLGDEHDMEDVDLGVHGDEDILAQNQRLKARVAQLEEALEGCLGLVSGGF